MNVYYVSKYVVAQYFCGKKTRFQISILPYLSQYCFYLNLGKYGIYYFLNQVKTRQNQISLGRPRKNMS